MDGTLSIIQGTWAVTDPTEEYPWWAVDLQTIVEVHQIILLLQNGMLLFDVRYTHYPLKACPLFMSWCLLS